MVSTPGFDPNAFARGITLSEWQRAPRQSAAAPEQQGDRRHLPARLDLQGGDGAGGAGIQGDRSRGRACPAPATCSSATSSSIAGCSGGHGSTNVTEAITASCDCFFYEAARRPASTRSPMCAGRLGFGRLSELGLPGESAGIQPSRRGSRTSSASPGSIGDTFNLGIGQGYMNATPLQLAVMTARIANGGYEVQPNLLLASATPREELAPPPQRDKPTAPPMRFAPHHLGLVRDGMFDVVNSSVAPPISCASTPRASCSSRSSASPARPAPARSSASPSTSARWASPRPSCPGICATMRCSSASAPTTARAMPAP